MYFTDEEYAVIWVKKAFPQRLRYELGVMDAESYSFF